MPCIEANFQPIHRKKIAEEDTVLIDGLGLNGGHAPVGDEAPARLGFEDAENGVGVAYVKDQKHGLLSVERTHAA